MHPFKRILLIAPSEMIRTPAFERAESLAFAAGALLHIVAFADVMPPELAGLFNQDAVAQAREGYLQIHRHWLLQQARFQRHAGLQITCEVVCANQSPKQVLAYVNDFQPDLVIKDVQHISALDRTFHSPLDWLLLRECPTCLHLVTEARHPKPLKVLAAIDLSHLEELTYGLNERILKLASSLARTCDAQLHLLNVSNWSVVGDAVTSVPTQSLDSGLSEAVNDAQAEAFDALAERHGIEKNHQHVLIGVPHKVISQFAERNGFDMLLLGMTHGDGHHQVIGSTAESVLNRTSCSSMIVKALPRPLIETGQQAVC